LPLELFSQALIASSKNLQTSPSHDVAPEKETKQ